MIWFFLRLVGEKWYLEMTEVTSPRTLSLLLVSLADKKLGLTRAMTDAFTDNRDQDKVVHGVIEMARERIYAICQAQTIWTRSVMILP